MTYNNIPLLPSIDEQLRLLSETGRQFHGSESARAVFHIDDDAGSKSVLYDTRTVPYIPDMIVPDTSVCNALRAIRPSGVTTEDASSFIDTMANTQGFIIGFSGYDGTGREYHMEQEGIDAILTGCMEADVPIDCVVDDGRGLGVSGLSGLLAATNGLKTIGVTPLAGLQDAAPRGTLVVQGKEFGDEAAIISAIPDVLVVFDGGPVTHLEAEAAINMGGMVITALLKTYDENSAVYLCENSKKARRARAAGRLVACETSDEIVRTLEELDLDRLRGNRPRRGAYLHGALKTA